MNTQDIKSSVKLNQDFEQKPETDLTLQHLEGKEPSLDIEVKTSKTPSTKIEDPTFKTENSNIKQTINEYNKQEENPLASQSIDPNTIQPVEQEKQMGLLARFATAGQQITNTQLNENTSLDISFNKVGVERTF